MSRYNKSIIILGSARSGTSWLSEIIAQQHRYRMLFEPEHEHRTAKGPLLCDAYYPNIKDEVQADRYMRQVLQNRVDCDWIGQISNRKYKRHLWPFIPKKYIIKMVRANLLGATLVETYKVPVIHTIRNPYEVIHSQLRVHFPWLFDLSRFASQPELVDLILKHFQFDIRDYEQLNEEACLTLRWCIENVIPLEVLPIPTQHFEIVRHEILSGDIATFRALCTRYDLEPLADLEQRFKNPSSKSHPRSQFLKDDAPKRSLLNETQMLAVNGILKQFKTQLYPIVDTYIK